MQHNFGTHKIVLFFIFYVHVFDDEIHTDILYGLNAQFSCNKI